MQNYVEKMWEALQRAQDKWFKCAICSSQVDIHPTAFGIGLIDFEKGLEGWTLTDFVGAPKDADGKPLFNSNDFFPSQDDTRGWLRIRISESNGGVTGRYARKLICPVCKEDFIKENDGLFA